MHVGDGFYWDSDASLVMLSNWFTRGSRHHCPDPVNVGRSTNISRVGTRRGFIPPHNSEVLADPGMSRWRRKGGVSTSRVARKRI